MKKLALLLIVVVVVLFTLGCVSGDSVVGSLPAYDNREYYIDASWQDSTDYGKYFYSSIDKAILENNHYFSEVSEIDVQVLLAHIENFESWVYASEREDEVSENYDFDKSIVSVGDYFYIKTLHGQPIGQGTYGRFDNYTVYYFDVEAQILYLFHNNI